MIVGINRAFSDGGLIGSSYVDDPQIATYAKSRTYADAVRNNVKNSL